MPIFSSRREQDIRQNKAKPTRTFRRVDLAKENMIQTEEKVLTGFVFRYLLPTKKQWTKALVAYTCQNHFHSLAIDRLYAIFTCRLRNDTSFGIMNRKRLKAVGRAYDTCLHSFDQIDKMHAAVSGSWNLFFAANTQPFSQRFHSDKCVR